MRDVPSARLPAPAIPIPREAIAEFCRRHRIRELALFGSVLRTDFAADSDIDVLVDFEPGTRMGLAFFGLGDELEAIFHRRVDCLTREWLSPYFRDEVLRDAHVVYAAA